MDWQTVIAMSAVVAAAVWLARRSWRVCRGALSGKPMSSCGQCDRAADATKSMPLVQLGQPPAETGDNSSKRVKA